MSFDCMCVFLFDIWLISRIKQQEGIAVDLVPAIYFWEIFFAL
jgi:hypothetical protein